MCVSFLAIWNGLPALLFAIVGHATGLFIADPEGDGILKNQRNLMGLDQFGLTSLFTACLVLGVLGQVSAILVVVERKCCEAKCGPCLVCLWAPTCFCNGMINLTLEIMLFKQALRDGYSALGVLVFGLLMVVACVDYAIFKAVVEKDMEKDEDESMNDDIEMASDSGRAKTFDHERTPPPPYPGSEDGRY